jgi:cellulose synthase/poly-beta-1,6-N-acetylglucosamine synthase-like glycosyltransferase
LEYPEGKLEIIIVDDDSTDETYEIISNFIKDKTRFKLIKPTKQIAAKPGKANALANGIDISSGEIILTTDADCVVSRTWAITLASYYKEDVAFVGGFTTQNSGSLFKGMQSVDFVYLLTVAAGTINLGQPVSCIGNNMSFTRKAYDEIGGYASIPFSVTEDLALIKKIKALKKYKIIYPMDKGSLVVSKPLENVKSIYHQKKRWGVGGLKTEALGFFVMATGFFANLLVLLSPFVFSTSILYLVFFKLVSDYLLLFSSHKYLNLSFSFINYLVFEIYYTIYVIILPFVVFINQDVNWKGREY